jgi:hypothetical protein
MPEKSILEVLPSYVQAAALVVAGGWAYWKFIIQRSNEPATDIDIDLKFIGRQDGQWIIEVTSFLKNQSQVRLEYKNFQVGVRYLLPEDKVKDGDEDLVYQLDFPNTIDDRIKPNKRRFENAVYINPKQEFRHRYITSVPVNATFVWVRCKFFFMLRDPKPVKVNSQRIFRVPDSEPKDIATTKP